jgi:hypothetical protein
MPVLRIYFLKLFDAAKRDAIENNIIHSHHQCGRNHKLTPAVIDLVRRLRDRMSRGGEQLQLLIGTGYQIPGYFCNIYGPAAEAKGRLN